MARRPPGSDADGSPAKLGLASIARGNAGKAKRLVIACLLVAALGIPVVGTILRERHQAENLLAHESRLAVADVEVINARRLVHSEEEIPSRTTFSEFFERAGLGASLAERIVRAARPVYDLSRVRAGNRVDIIRNGNGEFRAITYEIDRDNILWVTAGEDSFHAEIRPVPYEIVVEGVKGTVRDSLFQAVADEGEGDWLTIEIADIFGWDIDFSTDTRQGDTFEVVVEKKMLNGERWGYGRVLAAQYQNEGQLHQAVLFRDPQGRPAYYAPSGKSMQKAFLRSPLRFGARVTSGFSNRRFHPILKRYRPHHGVDYGAPTGSAVQAVGDGRVVFAGRKGGSGRMVHLRHAKGYETYYLHLSRILVKPGQRVQQGQLIARSGATGLATGPHLDFRVTRHGKFLNFLRLKLPPREAVAEKDWEEFVSTRAPLLDQLASLHAEPAAVSAEARPAPAEPNVATR